MSIMSNHYSVIPQLQKLVEECIELADAAIKMQKSYSRGITSEKDVKNLEIELTDVYTLSTQVAELFDLDPFNKEKVEGKIKKQLKGLPIAVE